MNIQSSSTPNATLLNTASLAPSTTGAGQSGKVLPPGADATANNAPANAVGTVNNGNASNNGSAAGNNAVASIMKTNEASASAEAEAKAQSDKTLEQAVDTANEFVQTVQRDLHFSIDQESERTVVKVIESSSGDIIRQIPNESFLELARKMKELGELTLVNATG